MSDLESRIRRLEDRTLISERVIKYATGVDRRDWEMFADCSTDPVHVDFSASGVPAADFARDDLVDLVRIPLSGFTATQHLSPNHVIEFVENDPDRAICTTSRRRGWRLLPVVRLLHQPHASHGGRMAHREPDPARQLVRRQPERRRRSHGPIPDEAVRERRSLPAKTQSRARGLAHWRRDQSAGLS